MYRHDRGTHPVEWRPQNEERAEQAMQDVLDPEFVWDDERNRRTVDPETADKINQRYQELGGDGQ